MEVGVVEAQEVVMLAYLMQQVDWTLSFKFVAMMMRGHAMNEILNSVPNVDGTLENLCHCLHFGVTCGKDENHDRSYDLIWSFLPPHTLVDIIAVRYSSLFVT